MERSRRVRHLTLAATALGSALAFLDTTVVVVALPRMEADLKIGLAGQQWVYLSYALTLSALYLVSGAVGDRIGLRRTFVAGISLFALASVLCALATSEAALITGRALQGVGGAALTTTSLALLRVTWAGEAGRAIGLWTSLTSVSTVAGPALGGLVVEALSWRFVFLINVPLGAVAIALALAGRGTGESAPERGSLDVAGAVLVAVGLAGVTYALVEVRERGLGHVLPFLLAGLAALGLLAAWTRRARHPLVPPWLLRLPGLARANAVTLVIYAALGAHVLFLPVFVQFLGFSPVLAGLVFAPPGLALVLLAPRFGALADRRGPRLPIAAGAAAIGLAVLLLVLVSTRADAWRWGSLSIGLFAIGLAGVVAPITAAALAPAPPALAGIASGLNQTVARIGGILSVAALGALAGGVFAAAGGTGPTPFDPAAAGSARQAGLDAFHAVAVAIAVLAFAAAALAALLLPRRAASAPSAGAAEVLGAPTAAGPRAAAARPSARGRPRSP